MKNILLVHPPVVKPSEPPPGIARLQGTLVSHGIPCSVFDANIEGILWLLETGKNLPLPDSTWSKRCIRNVLRNIEAIRNPETFAKIDRYKRAVIDLNKALEISAYPGSGYRVSLSNLEHSRFSPVRSNDIYRAFDAPEENPFYPHFSNRLDEIINESRPAIIGFSLNYLSQVLTAAAMVGFLRSHFSGITIIAGGGLITSWARRPDKPDALSGLFDNIIAGAGEEPLVCMAGVPFRKDIRAIPDYHSLPLSDYLSPRSILPYNTSTGCYWGRCSFCPEQAEGNSFVPRPPHIVMDDLDRLVSKNKPVLIHFTDNALSPVMLKMIARNSLGIPWYGFTRITGLLADQEFCFALKRSGCAMLKLGLESGDQGVIDAMGKGIDLDTSVRALAALKKAGIGTYVYIMFGTPYETILEARKTLDFIADNASRIDYLNTSIFNLPAYSRQARELDLREFYSGDLSLYSDFHHPSGFDRKNVRIFLDNEFRRHPAISAILRRDPPFFTSNHAPFFCL